MSKKKKIIISSVAVGIVILGVILTIILVNIKRFSLIATDYLNFNNHTTMNIIELDSSVTPSSSTPYNNGTTIITNNSTTKKGIFSYSQNKTIVDTEYVMPETCEEVLNVCGGEAAIYGGMREGLVFRSVDGVNSFKAVDNNFLVKYHG